MTTRKPYITEFQEGYNAYIIGLEDLHNNPYQEGKPYEQWRKGWLKANKDHITQCKQRVADLERQIDRNRSALDTLRSFTD